MKRTNTLVYGLLLALVAVLANVAVVTPNTVTDNAAMLATAPDAIENATGQAPTNTRFAAEVPQVTTSRCLTNNGNSTTFANRTGVDTNTADAAFTNNRREDEEGRAAGTNPSVMAWRSKPTLQNSRELPANTANTATACAVNTKVQRTIDDEGRVNNGPMALASTNTVINVNVNWAPATTAS